MKKLLQLPVFFLIIIILSDSACTKTVHYRPRNIIDTIANREVFACRINGVPYVPKSASKELMGSCIFRTVYTGAAGSYLEVNGYRHGLECKTFSVSITLDSIQVHEGSTYILGSKGTKKNYGTYFFMNTCTNNGTVELYTTDENPGQLTITRFDPAEQFITGTFSFQVRDKQSGRLYNISDGDFKRRFTH
jgi:Family of unknown function (DUF6252)